MTFERLAEYVADVFREDIKDGGFDSFREMKECYCWDAKDIKNEADYIINNYANELWKENHDDGDFFMWDDGSHVQIGINDMSWRDFKKLVFGNVERMSA